MYQPAPQRRSAALETTPPRRLYRFAVGGELAGKREKVVGDLLICLLLCFLAVRELLKMPGYCYHRPYAVGRSGGNGID